MKIVDFIWNILQLLLGLLVFPLHLHDQLRHDLSQLALNLEGVDFFGAQAGQFYELGEV